jgi:hypothetical protein
MEQENKIEEVIALKPAQTTMERWKQEKMVKKAKKKARNTAMKQGYSKNEATKLVKQAVGRMMNKPTTRGASRGG